MKTDTADRIVEYIKRKVRATPRELVVYLSISPQAVFKHLRKLVDNNVLYKTGRPPAVYYSLIEKEPAVEDININPDLEKTIESNFLVITPSGEYRAGLEGFVYWCRKFNLPVSKTAQEYGRTLEKYNAYKSGNLINGMDKFRSTFETVHLDHVCYLDFYAIERFGKTKLGQLLLSAKQGQDRGLIRLLTEEIKPGIDSLIQKYEIDGVGYIPPTIKREIQFMKELKRNLNLNVKEVSIIKLKPPVIVAQKSLSKLEDRIENARNTIVVNEERHFRNILLIDDAVGSGATFNETAARIREKKICSGRITGLAVTGSFKGFDVISEI